MAKITFNHTEKFGHVLGYWETRFLDDEALKRVVVPGAKIIADALRTAIEGFQTYKMQKKAYRKGKMSAAEGNDPVWLDTSGTTSIRSGITEKEKKIMLKHFGVAPIKRDRDGFLHTKIGWNGYASRPRKGFPKGFPVPYMVRTIESGASWRKKQPFIRKAVRKHEKAAIEAMQKALDEELDDIFNFEGRT